MSKQYVNGRNRPPWRMVRTLQNNWVYKIAVWLGVVWSPSMAWMIAFEESDIGAAFQKGLDEGHS